MAVGTNVSNVRGLLIASYVRESKVFQRVPLEWSYFSALSCEVMYGLMFFIKALVKNRIANAKFLILDWPVILVTNENDLCCSGDS